MKYLFSTLIICVFLFTTHAQENFSKIRIDLQMTSLDQIAELGIDVTEGGFARGKFLETDLSASQISKLDIAEITYTVIYENVSEFYASRAAADKVDVINRDVTDDWVIPDHWEYGSMGGFYTLSEVMDELDEMYNLYPELVSAREPLSATNLSHDGRMQYWVRLSDNPNINEDEPEVLYTGVHHAREPMSVQQMIYYMWYLLENYDTDDGIKQLVDNTEMYFVPVLNPDGYEYNNQTNPNGGGMWRKNRRNNGGGSYGVDPNRNYGYMWGNDNSGSSPNPNDETYRGPEAFSEPEIQNVRDFCNEHEFKIALNYHSYSDLLLYTWGWTEDPCEHDEILHDFSVIMTQENSYTYGAGSTTIYPTNGGSDDWMYGEQTTKDVILSYTPEVGSYSDGFWPTTSRIIPLCQEQMWQNISAARLVGGYADVSDLSPMIIGDIVGYLPFDIKRLGLSDGEFTVSIQPLDDSFVSIGDPITFENLEIMENAIDSIEYSLDAGIESGTAISYLLSVDNGSYIVSDTIEKVFGDLVVVFNDGCDDMEYWTSNEWNITTSDFYSSPASITDSPNTEYQDDEYNVITLDTIIDFTDVTMAFVQFWAKWEIESGYDYVQFMIKDVNQGNWVALEGKHTRTGTYYQQEGEPVYDGFYSYWVKEEIALSDYLGTQVQFKFILVSDGSVTEDGYYIDDFNISVVSSITDIHTQSMVNNGLYLSDAFPNPSKNQISIKYQLGLNQQPAMLEIVDLMGNVVISQPINNLSQLAIIDVAKLSDGVYFYRILTKNNMSEVKRFVKQ